jgi:hypothetical protein
VAALLDIRPCDKTTTQTEAAQAPAVAATFQLAASIRRRKNKIVPAVAAVKTNAASIAKPTTIRKPLMNTFSSKMRGSRANPAQKQEMQFCMSFVALRGFVGVDTSNTLERSLSRIPRETIQRSLKETTDIQCDSFVTQHRPCTAVVTVFVVIEVNAPKTPGPIAPERLQIRDHSPRSYSSVRTGYET